MCFGSGTWRTRFFAMCFESGHTANSRLDFSHRVPYLISLHSLTQSLPHSLSVPHATAACRLRIRRRRCRPDSHAPRSSASPTAAAPTCMASASASPTTSSAPPPCSAPLRSPSSSRLPPPLACGHHHCHTMPRRHLLHSLSSPPLEEVDHGRRRVR